MKQGEEFEEIIKNITSTTKHQRNPNPAFPSFNCVTSRRERMRQHSRTEWATVITCAQGTMRAIDRMEMSENKCEWVWTCTQGMMGQMECATTMCGRLSNECDVSSWACGPVLNVSVSLFVWAVGLARMNMSLSVRDWVSVSVWEIEIECERLSASAVVNDDVSHECPEWSGRMSCWWQKLGVV